MNPETVTEIRAELELVAEETCKIMDCLTVLEHCLYFMSERNDRDISKPCATFADMILDMVGCCHDEIFTINSIIEAA